MRTTTGHSPKAQHGDPKKDRSRIIRCRSHFAFLCSDNRFYTLLFDILLTLDAGDISFLAAVALLGLCAAFDTVNHTILMQRQRTSFDPSGAIVS